MSLAIGWWVAAGVAAAAELLTGTFVLLMIAVGLALAGVLASAGAGLPSQLMAAALGSGLAWAGLRQWRRRRENRPVDAQFDPAVNLDIGQTVQVEAWATDGTATVHYRGAAWQARLAENATAHPGPYRIQAIQGSQLLLSDH